MRQAPPAMSIRVRYMREGILMNAKNASVLVVRFSRMTSAICSVARRGQTAQEASLVIWGPKTGGGDVGKVGEGGRGDLDNGIHGKGAVTVAVQVFSGDVKDACGLEVGLQVREDGVHAGGLGIIEGVLVHGLVDLAQIIKNASGLRTFARPEPAGDGDGGEEGDDGDDDHHFHESEAAALFVESLEHEGGQVGGRAYRADAVFPQSGGLARRFPRRGDGYDHLHRHQKER